LQQIIANAVPLRNATVAIIPPAIKANECVPESVNRPVTSQLKMITIIGSYDAIYINI
jgi:hypothetical protein